jgi:xanthosine utilization system XapX-like protein
MWLTEELSARRIDIDFQLLVGQREEAEMPETNGILEGLMDFSFRRYAAPRMLKFLYAIHLLAGLIAGVAWVVLAFQQAPVQGLVALLGALVGYSLWILYCRTALEVLAAVFRIANAVAPSRGDSQQQEYSESSVAEMVGAR